MRLIPLLFSFKGRISREPYWLFFGACLFLPVVLQVEKEPFLFFALIVLWSMLAIIVKRYHDLDRSGLWALLHLLIPPIGMIQCGFLRGTPGVNRFGPDPLIDSIASRTKKLLFLVGGVALVLIGLMLFIFIIVDSLSGKTLEFGEAIMGTVLTIGLWWGAYFYLRRALTRSLTPRRTDEPQAS